MTDDHADGAASLPSNRGNRTERSGFLQLERLRMPPAGLARLLILRAPSGAGKTTTLERWRATDANAEHRSIFLSGHRLRIGDQALENALSTVKSSPARTRVIIDDFEQIDSKETARFVYAALTNLPQLSFIISTRATTVFESRTMHRDLLVLGPEQFLLSPDEREALARRLSRVQDRTPPAEELPDLAGFVSMLAAGRTHLTERRNGTLRFRPEGLTAYAEHLLSDDPDPQGARAIADSLCCFDRIAMEHVAQAVNGVTDDTADAVVRRLERLGIGFVDDAYREFQLISPLREELRASLRKRDPERYRALRSLAAEQATERGHLLDALRAHVELRQFRAATGVCTRFNMPQFTEQVSQVAAILEPMSQADLKLHPLLCGFLACGLFRDPNRQWRALSLFEIAIDQLAPGAPRAPRLPSEQFLYALVRLISLRLAGRYDDLPSATETLLSVMSTHEAELRERLPQVLDHAEMRIAETQLQCGQSVEAGNRLIRGTLSQTNRHPGTTSFALAMLAATNAEAGDIRLATTSLDEQREISRLSTEGPDDPSINLYLQLANGWLALERGDFTDARVVLERGMDRLLVLDSVILCAEPLAWAYIGLGIPDQGVLAIRRMMETIKRQRTPSPPSDTAFTHARILLYTANGHTARADDLAERRVFAPTIVQTTDQARIALLHQNYERATSALSRRRLTPQAPPRRAAEHLIIGAAAALGIGERTSAQAQLEQASFILEVNGLALPLVGIDSHSREALVNFTTEHPRLQRIGQKLQAAPSMSDPRQHEFPNLSQREMVVLEALALEESRAGIAEQLSVSKNTVKTQLNSLYRKLGAHNRAEALASAARFNLLDRPAG